MTSLNQEEREAGTLGPFLSSSLQHLESDDGEFLTCTLQQFLAPPADLPRQQASSLVYITQGLFQEVNKGKMNCLYHQNSQRTQKGEETKQRCSKHHPESIKMLLDKQGCRSRPV